MHIFFFFYNALNYNKGIIYPVVKLLDFLVIIFKSLFTHTRTSEKQSVRGGEEGENDEAGLKFKEHNVIKIFNFNFYFFFLFLHFISSSCSFVLF